MEYGSGLRIGVVGGSIAGCAMALAATNAGAEVTVYERSSGRLRERGFGIGVPQPLLEQLVEMGYLDPATPVHRVRHRIWVTRTERAGGERELWRQTGAAALCNWGLLWQGLYSRIPDIDYRTGASVDEVRADEHGVTLRTAGSEQRFDMVIGADGYRSTIRHLIDPHTAPQLAGYALWRACYPESLVPHAVPELTDGSVTVVFEHGHAVFYLIPDAPAGRRLNWAVYAYPPRSLRAERQYLPGDSTEAARFIKVFASTVLPARWAELISVTDDAAIAVYPVFDLAVPRYTAGPFALAGDAGALARPHTASGAVKAVQDALCLQQALRDSERPADALARYDQLRRTEGNRLVQLGRRIGHDQVEATPDWHAMDAATMPGWTSRTLGSTVHYLYPGSGELTVR